MIKVRIDKLLQIKLFTVIILAIILLDNFSWFVSI